MGLPASPGAATGEIVFSSDDAEDLKAQGRKAILVRIETSPEDIHGMHASEGILTTRGGMTSHAAVVARGMGTPAVTGVAAMSVDLDARAALIGDVTIHEGDVVTIDGTTGGVYPGLIKLVEPEETPELQRLLAWADDVRTLGVRANADTPADAEAVSHKLLVRAGFIRQLTSGVYSILPLGRRACRKIESIVRREMDAIGGQEFSMPSLHPAEIWKRSGRWDSVGAEMFRLVDRKGADSVLGMTHEEVFATIASELRSYRQLPQIWYQVDTKFRDEPRPKSGLLRVREFTMKDSYSLDIDEAGPDRSFRKHFEAYRKIFASCGLDTLAVEASSGAMGGSESHEFVIPSEAGRDWGSEGPGAGYAGDPEKAMARAKPAPPRPDPAPCWSGG